MRVIGTWALAAAAVFGLAGTLACSSPGAAGEFDDDAGHEPAPPPDLFQHDCDPRRTNDCPAGQKCSYVVDPSFGPTNRCVALLGEGLEGDSCELLGDSDDCAAHKICWATDADGSGGVCVEFCTTSLTCGGDVNICSVASGGLLPLCLPRCDPLAQDCAEGWGCYPDKSRRWVCDRDQSGALGGHGEPCACLNCCAPGFACLSGALIDAEGCGVDGAESCCGLICPLDQAATQDVCPTEAERCVAVYDALGFPAGYENVGLCRL